MSVPDDILPIATVVAQYPFPPGTLRHWMRSSLLPSFRLGRRRFVRRQDVERMIERALEADRSKREAP